MNARLCASCVEEQQFCSCTQQQLCNSCGTGDIRLSLNETLLFLRRFLLLTDEQNLSTFIMLDRGRGALVNCPDVFTGQLVDDLSATDDEIQKNKEALIESWRDGSLPQVFAVEPPVIQNCIGPYNNAFHGVRPVFELCSQSRIMDLEQNWLAAVKELDYSKLPQVARMCNPRHLARSRLACTEREERICILNDEAATRCAMYPFSILMEEDRQRSALEQSWIEELATQTWDLLYTKNFLASFEGQLNGATADVYVKSIVGSMYAEVGGTRFKLFPRMPGGNSVPFLALQVLHRARANKRALRTMHFVRFSKKMSPSKDFLQHEETCYFLDMTPSASFRYLINVKIYSPSAAVKILSCFHESLWYNEMSWDDLRCTCNGFTDSVASLHWDYEALYTKREMKQFLDTIRPLTPDEFHWRARCLSPGAGCVWSPDNDKYWPMLFRKIIRYCLQIRVAAGISGVGHLPHEVVEIIGTFL